jgi:hypothetical protein
VESWKEKTPALGQGSFSRPGFAWQRVPGDEYEKSPAAQRWKTSLAMAGMSYSFG